jgi:hypothetical protein
MLRYNEIRRVTIFATAIHFARRCLTVLGSGDATSGTTLRLPWRLTLG